MPRKRRYSTEQIITKPPRSRHTTEPREISRRDRQGVRDQQTNLLSLAQRVWGLEHDPGKETQGTRKRECQVENPGSRSIFG